MQYNHEWRFVVTTSSTLYRCPPITGHVAPPWRVSGQRCCGRLSLLGDNSHCLIYSIFPVVFVGPKFWLVLLETINGPQRMNFCDPSCTSFTPTFRISCHRHRNILSQINVLWSLCSHSPNPPASGEKRNTRQLKVLFHSKPFVWWMRSTDTLSHTLCLLSYLSTFDITQLCLKEMLKQQINQAIRPQILVPWQGFNVFVFVCFLVCEFWHVAVWMKTSFRKCSMK